MSTTYKGNLFPHGGHTYQLNLDFGNSNPKQTVTKSGITYNYVTLSGFEKSFEIREEVTYTKPNGDVVTTYKLMPIPFSSNFY